MCAIRSFPPVYPPGVEQRGGGFARPGAKGASECAARRTTTGRGPPMALSPDAIWFSPQHGV